MELFAIIGLAVVATVLCMLLKQYRPEYAVIVALACGVLLFAGILVNLLPAFQSLSLLMQKTAVGSQYAGAIVKALGICYVTQLAADSCKDAGQTAIAGKVELAGKVSVAVLALPLFENLVEIVFSLVNTGL